MRSIASVMALVALVFAALGASAEQAKPAPKRAESAPMPALLRPWTGDWDEMVKRRALRVDLGKQLTPIPGLVINGEPEKRQWRVHFSIGQAF